MKYDTMLTENNMQKIIKTRGMQDKKGGGLMLLYKKSAFDYIEQLDHTNPDIMVVKVEKGKIVFKVSMTYMYLIVLQSFPMCC